MRAEIISIGEELLSGDSDIVDTNSIFITKALHKLGIKTFYKTTVGDHEDRITEVILNALSRADVIITSGGLGPTVDDMTRQGVANAIGQTLELRPDLLEEVAAKFAKLGVRMSENNRAQAMLPVSAKPMLNPVGTAPGFIVEYAGRTIFGVPGVPREMRYLIDNVVIPYLKDRVADIGIVKVRVLRTAGIGESLLDEQVGDLEKLANPIVGLAAHTGHVDIRLYATAPTEAEADALNAAVEATIRERVGSYIYGVDKDPLETAFIMAVRKTGGKVVLAESGTGNYLSRLLLDQYGAADVIEIVPAEEVAALQAAHQGPDYREITNAVAQALWTTHPADLVLAVFSSEAGTAVALTNGKQSRARAYAFGGGIAEAASNASAEWVARWGMSMGWWLASNRD